MEKNLVYSKCECGGAQVSEWKPNEFTEFKYCLKCGTFEERFPEGYPEEFCKTRQQKGLTFLTLSKGGGYGSTRLVMDEGETHEIFLFNSKESLFEMLDNIVDHDSNGELGLDFEQSFVYLHDPKLGSGEVIYGHGNPDDYHNLYGTLNPCKLKVRVHAVKELA